jgi:outer membrane protein
MKKIVLIFFLVSVVVMTSAIAETLPSPIIGIVEQATLDSSAAFKSIIDQIEKKRAEIQKEMTTIENELKAQDKQLIEEQKKLSEKEFAEKRATFEKRVHDAQEKIEIRRAQMELAVEDAKKKVYEAFLKVAEEVKKDVGANIIMYKETIVTADNALDLTNQVKTKLDKVLPTVKVVYKSEAEVKKQLMQQPQQ